jgi:Rrf2 family protein
MRIARETDYAIRSILFMARTPATVFTVREIAVPQEIPPSFLAKILQKLTRAGITASARGSRGGFRLAGDPGEITLLGVIQAVEGRLAADGCLVEGRVCSRAGRCSVHPVWREVREEIAGRLGACTIRRLLDADDAVNRRETGGGGEAS